MPNRLTPQQFRVSSLGPCTVKSPLGLSTHVGEGLAALLLGKVAQGVAGGYAALDMNAHAITKKKMRANALTALRSAIEAEFGA